MHRDNNIVKNVNICKTPVSKLDSITVHSKYWSEVMIHNY